MKKTLHSKEYKRLVSWLRQQRIAQNLTIRELATKLNVSHSFVGKIEQGERRLDVIEYLTYCSVLGVSPTKGLKAVNELRS